MTIISHQGDLLYSLQLLLEKRLGYNLFRPVGMEWFYNGYWDIGNPYPNPADTAKQYLGIDDRTWDAYKNLNGDYHLENGVYMVYDPVHQVHQKAITFEKFKEMKIDIIIASYPFGHEQTYRKLRDELKPEAKFIVQIGNIGQQSQAENIMCSTARFPTDKNIVSYHQEFDLNIYRPQELDALFITSFINKMPMLDLFEAVEKLVPDYFFKSFGGSCRDGSLSRDLDIANYMNQSKFGWHVKPGGDGFGHVIHNWFAVGKPIITNISDYQYQLAGQLLTDGETCIDVDRKSPEAIADLIKFYSQPENYKKMCENVYNRFKEIVNYDKEAEQVKEFLNNLN